MASVDYTLLKRAIDIGIDNLKSEILSNVNIFTNNEYGLSSIKNAIKVSGTDIAYKYLNSNTTIVSNTGFTSDKQYWKIISEMGSGITLDNFSLYRPSESRSLTSVISGVSPSLRRQLSILLAKKDSNNLPIFDMGENNIPNYQYLLNMSSSLSDGNSGSVPNLYIDLIRESDVTKHSNYSPDRLFFYNSAAHGAENINNPSYNDIFIFGIPNYSCIYNINYRASDANRVTYIHIIIPDDGLYIPDGYGLFYSHFFFNSETSINFKFIYH